MPDWRKMVLLVCLVVSATAPTAGADTFLMSTGALLQGELVNVGRKADDVYIVRLSSGGQWTLAADRVRSHRAKSDTQIEYEALRLQTPDTAAGHWVLAVWCEKNKLAKEKLFHWNQVVKHEPDHAEARAKLRHRKIKGEWISQRELRERQGQVLYRGTWQMKSLVEKRQRQDQTEVEQKDWRKKIRLWRGWLSNDRRRSEGLRNIRAIDDPMAAWALDNLIRREKNKDVREEYIDALGRIGTSRATNALLRSVIEDPSETLRNLAYRKVSSRDVQQTLPWLIGQLRTPDTRRIDRASVALKELGEPSAILPLIDALVTRRVATIQQGGEGQVNAGFGPGGIGFGAGAKKVTGTETHKSREALAALISLTDGVNHNYRQNDWWEWYDKKATPEDIDLRRGT